MPKRPAPSTSRFQRAFVALLAALFALQPIASASPKCAIAGLLGGRGGCCCAEIASAPGGPAKSCCSAGGGASRADAASVVASAKRCGCGIDAPEPPGALPRDTGARGENGSERALLDWIGQGAHASASTPIHSTASPPFAVDRQGTAPPGPCPVVPGSSAPGFARGARGLLAVTCVARC